MGTKEKATDIKQCLCKDILRNEDVINGIIKPIYTLEDGIFCGCCNGKVDIEDLEQYLIKNTPKEEAKFNKTENKITVNGNRGGVLALNTI